MRTYSRFLLLVAAVCVAASLASAVPFEPVFRLLQVNGDVSVKTPDAGRFSAAEEGKAYPYGTSVRTGAGAAVIVMYAENNSARVGPSANLSVESTSILLEGGKIEIVLEEGNELAVATPCSSVQSVGGAFSAEVKAEAELLVTVFAAQRGALTVMSDMFQCPAITEGVLSVSCAQDGSFVRLKNVKGKFAVIFKDDTNTARTVDMDVDAVLKIWRRGADESDAIVVTILIVAPDGSLTEAINYTIAPAAAADDGADAEDGDDDDDDDGDDDDDDIAPPVQTDPGPGDDDDDDDDDDQGGGGDDDDDQGGGGDDDDDQGGPGTTVPPDWTPKGLR
jgi:hypothetical protein